MSANDRDVTSQARAWLEDDPDPGTRRELETLIQEENTSELTERFASRLEFGTAGIRGLLGAGREVHARQSRPRQRSAHRVGRQRELAVQRPRHVAPLRPRARLGEEGYRQAWSESSTLVSP